MSWVALCVSVLAAALITLQAGANARLNQTLRNPLVAALVVYGVGLAGVGIALLVSRGAGRPPWPGRGLWAQVPPWAWLGGGMGLVYVFAMLLFANRLGSALFSAVTLTASMATSLVLDHEGWAGFQVRPLTPWRVVGGLLMAGGAALIARF